MPSAKVSMTWQSKELVKLTQKAMMAGLREAGKEARRGIKGDLSAPGPSSPGAPPGRVDGTLRKAIAMRSKTRSGKFVAVDVGVLNPSRYDEAFPGEQHAKALRLARGYVGRDRLGRIYRQRPRPFVDPYLTRNRARLASIVESTASTWMPKAKKEKA